MTVPEIDLQLTDAQLTYLCNTCNPLEDDGNSGKNVFVPCKDLLFNVFSL